MQKCQNFLQFMYIESKDSLAHGRIQGWGADILHHPSLAHSQLTSHQEGGQKLSFSPQLKSCIRPKLAWDDIGPST